ncbi:Two component system response regulator, sigma54-specific [Desulfonema limicola]|uniref:Two component system response regulator, sigma54-specific n=1 Tax=Desulfonema limicola TaxID=45656 RepID=A0A975GGG6_9BACT|nr:sigma-54 dependent transcriptional regulator [Desulfonema limicola]QTA80295.1 Two component system response regulator, sigma54-specific [Desulfonema limicola]
MKPAILIVDDDSGHRITLETIIKSWGYRTESAADGTEAVEKVQEKAFDLILMDVRMAVMSGIEALKKIKIYNPAIPILIMTAYSSVESAVEALKAGAYDYLTKPLDFDVLKLSIERACEHAGLKEENRNLREKLGSAFDLGNIIGKSQPMKDLNAMISMIAPSEATVLITGESGTGKELAARSVHYNSSRKDHSLITVNCAALAETLLESELFGHEKGAFTGADRSREGRFMQADKGTIFLDEVGEMPPMMQAKLLRVIQEGEIQRVGSDKPITVDVRILAATNKNLQEEVESGSFREDLFYRLNVVALKIPALRERMDDIPLLANHFTKKYAEKNRKQVKGITPFAMDMLLKYHWPGNVRELENAMERAVILLPGEYISEKELPLSITQSYAQEHGIETLENKFIQHSLSAQMPKSLEDIEKQAILTALETAGGNKSEAARILGINRKTLHKKLKNYEAG